MSKRVRSDGGDSLIEVLVALAVLGTTVVAIVSALGTAVIASEVHRKQATAGAVARSIAEALKDATYNGNCTATYAVPANVVVPSDYQVNAIAVSHWLPASSSFGTCVGTDSGVQRLTVQVRSAGTVRTTTEEVVVVIRKPCRPTDAACS